jgi:uncharacterized damage-inducible protein DinB
VAAIPEKHFDWAPNESSFSCGDLVRHLEQAEIYWRKLLEKATQGVEYDPFGLDGSADDRMKAFRSPNLEASRSPRLGVNFAECLASWGDIQAETEEILGSLSAEDLESARVRHSLTGLEGSVRQFVVVMLEHEAYHRGQLSAYMKMLGLEHPTSMWT